MYTISRDLVLIMSCTNTMSVRTLCLDLQRKAENELNEDPNRVEYDLNQLREWLEKQPHLRVRLEDQWLLTFLRGCKFSLEKTKAKIDSYYTLRNLIPEFFSNRDPFLPEIQEILSAGCFWLPLPKSPNPEVPRVLYINASFLKNNISVVNVMKVNFMIHDILLNEDDTFNVAGHQMFQDVKDASTNVILQVTPGLLKKCVICFRTAYPIRSKGIHFINLPSLLEAIIKPVLVRKRKGEIFIDSGENYENLHKLVPQYLLPKECGGTDGSISELISEWKKKVESYSDWFLEDAKYGSDETKRPGQPKTTGDMFGVDGSFRKLDID